MEDSIKNRIGCYWRDLKMKRTLLFTGLALSLAISREGIILLLTYDGESGSSTETPANTAPAGIKGISTEDIVAAPAPEIPSAVTSSGMCYYG